jgi:hypothetical protein
MGGVGAGGRNDPSIICTYEFFLKKEYTPRFIPLSNGLPFSFNGTGS